MMQYTLPLDGAVHLGGVGPPTIYVIDYQGIIHILPDDWDMDATFCESPQCESCVNKRLH